MKAVQEAVHGVSDDLLQQIARQHGTPVYVYSLDRIRERHARLQAALPQASVRYAVKANPSASVLRTLAQGGAGAEVITEGELGRAVAAGFSGDRIVVGGPAQDSGLRSAALRHGVGLVSLDSVSQWEDWQAEPAGAGGPEFLVRINPALDPRTHEHLATGAGDSKFGMSTAEGAEVAAAVSASARFAGFHVHAGSQISDLRVFEAVLAVLEPLCSRFPAEWLDIGGGYRVPGFPLSDYAALVSRFVEQHQFRLIIEPGRFLVADAGVLLTRVLHQKQGVLHHVIADAGMADMLRPALYGAQHPIRALSPEGSREPLTVEVDGPLCENSDRLGRNVQLPPLTQGDLLAVEEAGAYGLTMASNYASSFRPAEVVVENGAFRLVRRRETLADLLGLELEAEAAGETG